MHQLSMAQRPLQNLDNPCDLESVLRKIGSSRLPMEQNNLAILLTCDTLLHNEFVCDFDPKKSEAEANMRNSNVHRALRGLKERQIVISDSAGRIGINPDLDGWDIPNRKSANRKTSKKSRSKKSASKKSGKKQGGSGSRTGAHSQSHFVVKAEVIPPESDQIPEESEEISEDAAKILNDLEPVNENCDNTSELKNIPVESAGIQTESDQIFFKTKSRDNKNFCARVTPASQGFFFIKNDILEFSKKSSLIICGVGMIFDLSRHVHFSIIRFINFYKILMHFSFSFALLFLYFDPSNNKFLIILNFFYERFHIFTLCPTDN